jgi:hypothetical protein
MVEISTHVTLRSELDCVDRAVDGGDIGKRMVAPTLLAAGLGTQKVASAP